SKMKDVPDELSMKKDPVKARKKATERDLKGRQAAAEKTSGAEARKAAKKAEKQAEYDARKAETATETSGKNEKTVRKQDAKDAQRAERKAKAEEVEAKEAKTKKADAERAERKVNTEEELNAKFDEFEPYKGKTRTNGKTGKDKRLYQKDRTHNDIEVYNGDGTKHLGSMDPKTGEIYKGPVEPRDIKSF
ncbi:MAG: hypothetical protein GY795_00495, partial [Desulfobacterales bacterium]|nr:hypothetical protein [Desulfobacterales bacterium]